MSAKKATQVIVVMGSRSDLPVMKDATALLEDFDVTVKTQILSAHRTPQLLEKSVSHWHESGVKVIIAGAGGAAHLPGMLAAYAVCPVVGVPIKSKSMGGLDALLSVAQMPAGVPVATVAVNNAHNAALLALQILAVSDSSTEKKLQKYKENLSKKVHKDRERLQKVGVKEFLKA